MLETLIISIGLEYMKRYNFVEIFCIRLEYLVSYNCVQVILIDVI